MYSEQQFINKYSKSELISYTDFMKIARVRTGSQVVSLRTYIKNKQISSQQLKLLFQFIQTKDIYLRTFYKKSLETV